MAFIGHGIRIWDALAYFPILERFGMFFKYHIGDTGLVLVASSNQDFVDETCSIISSSEKINFSFFVNDQKLVIST